MDYFIKTNINANDPGSTWSNKHGEKNVNIKTTYQNFTAVLPLLRNQRQKTQITNQSRRMTPSSASTNNIVGSQSYSYLEHVKLNIV